MRLPTASEINIYGSIDEQYAQAHFLGKTLEGAEALFRENSLYYLDDLRWMGPLAFGFYLPAAIAFLESESSAHDSDAVNSFYSIVKARLDEEPRAVEPVAPKLRSGLRSILERWEKYDVMPEVYGNLKKRYADLLSRLDAL